MTRGDEFSNTQRIGDRIYALAEAEGAVAEAEGPPSAIAARLDNLIDELLSDS